MASITCWGTCVPPGPSRKTAGWPLTVCANDGNCERTQVRSRVEEETCSTVGIGGDIVNRTGSKVGPSAWCGSHLLRGGWIEERDRLRPRVRADLAGGLSRYS